MRWLPLIFCCLYLQGFTQLPDSLRIELEAKPTVEDKTVFLDSLADQMLRNNLRLHFLIVSAALELVNEKDSLYDHFLIKLGTNLLYKDQYDSARALFNRVLNRTNSNYQKAVAFSELGVSYYYESNDTKALENMIQSYQLWKNLNDTARLAGITNNIGVLHRYLGDYTASNRYLKEAIQFKQMLGQEQALGSSLHNLGVNYEELGSIDSAFLYLAKARAIRMKYNDLRGLTKTYNSLGTIHNTLDQLDSAEYYFRRAIDLDKKLGDQTALPWDQGSLALVLSKKGQHQEAISLAKMVIRNTNDVRVKMDALDVLAASLDATAAYKDASSTKRLLIILKDSIHAAEKETSLQELQVSFDTQQKEAEIEQLSAANKIQQLQAERDEQTRYVLFLAVGGLAVIAVLLYISFRNKARSNRLLDAKNHELATINQTKDRLFSIISHDLKSPLSSFHLITQSLAENLHSLDQKQIKEYLESLRDSSANVRDMMDNLLKWALAQTNQLSHRTESVEINQILKSVIGQLEGVSNYKSIEIKSSLADNLHIEGDGSFLEIILRNLISNSLKFTENGKVISIEAFDKGDSAMLRIADEGIGMDQEEVEKLLAGKIIGQEIQNSTEKGTGLGVTLVKELVLKMGGTISASSVRNEGTTFEIHFKKAA